MTTTISPLRPIGLTAARTHLSDLVALSIETRTPVYLERRGKRVAAIIAADDLDTLLEMAEDLADIRAADAARIEAVGANAQTGGADTSIPWEEVKAELGLV